MAGPANQTVAPTEWRSGLLSLGLAAAACVAGVAAGLVSSTGNLNMIAMIAGLLLACGLLMSRSALLWLVVLGGLVVVGAAQLYFPETRYIRYVLPVAGSGLILHGVLDRLNNPGQLHGRSGPAVWPWAVLFLIATVLSLAFNFNGVGNAVTGIKTYFQMWPFFAGMILVQWRARTIDSMPRVLLIIMLLQVPFVLHEYLYLVPLRQNLGSPPIGFQPVDVIAGTFGATMFRGGANAVLAAFMSLMAGCIIALWKHGALSGPRAFVLLLIGISPLLLNHTKISVLYLPLVFGVVFYRDMLRKPLKFLAAGACMAAILAALMTAMTLGNPNLPDKSWKGLIDFTIERQQTSINERTGQFSELTRWTALTFWAEEHVDQSPFYALIGHGPGASRVQDQGLDLAETHAERRYGGLQIGYTAISALLWDTGLIGLALTLGMFASAFRLAGRLAEQYRGKDPFKAGVFDGLRAGVALLVLSLFHKDFYIYHIPYQTLVLLVLGYLIVAARQADDEGASSRAGEMVTSPTT